MSTKNSESWITKEVRDKYGGRYITVQELAEKLGRSTATVKRWIRNGDVPRPKKKMPIGNGSDFAWLYGQSDIKKFQLFASTVKVGRPPKESA